MKKAVFTLLALSFSVFSIEAAAQEFEADMVNTSRSGVYNAHINVGKDKMRVESDNNIVISRMDKSVVWVLVPSQKIYMEQALDPTQMTVTSDKVDGETDRELMGTDNIDGYPVDKYKITYSLGGMQNVMYMWLSKSLNIPLKTQAADGSWMIEYKNIKKGPQPGQLFEIPSGYNKFDMSNMGDLMKGLTNEED